MPVTILQTKSKSGKTKYKVVTPGGVKAKGTTKKKAEAQAHLLNAIDHGFDPTGKKKGKGKKKSKRK